MTFQTRTAVPGELETASDYNTYVRDPLNFLRQNIAESFRGLRMRTHPDTDKKANQVALLKLDECVMSDATRYSGLTLPLTADITTIGAGGLDTGARAASTWYEIYLIGKSSSNSASDLRLILHRSKDYLIDTSFTTASDASRSLRFATSTPTDKLSQGVQFATAGKLDFVDVQLLKNNSPTGNFWISLYASSGGDATGSALATSDVMDVSKVATSEQRVRMIFRTPFTVVAGTQYHLVLEGDYTKSDTANLTWKGVAAGGYASGVGREYNGTVWANAAGVGDFNFRAYIRRHDAALTFPTGYDQSCFLGFVSNASVNILIPFIQTDRFHCVRNPGIVDAAIVSTIPLLKDLTDGGGIQGVIPPGPLMLFSQASQVTATDILRVTGVPDGYDSAIGAQVAAGLAAMAPLATEYQGLYVKQSAGTSALAVAGFLF